MVAVRWGFVLVVLHWGGWSTAGAEELHIAVASNFSTTLREIVKNFEHEAGHTPIVIAGSSGKLYAQVKHGAPFDVFFSADVRRPQAMEEEGLAVRGSRFTYAVGRLTLWSPDSRLRGSDGPTVLEGDAFDHLAMANPKTAPYGLAARQTLEALGLWEKLKGRIVRGENVGQTFQFVFSGNAQLGFVALSQVLDSQVQGMGSWWVVPSALHSPLRQQAVLLIHGRFNEAAKAFLNYVQGPAARDLIQRAGYGVE